MISLSSNKWPYSWVTAIITLLIDLIEVIASFTIGSGAHGTCTSQLENCLQFANIIFFPERAVDELRSRTLAVIKVVVFRSEAIGFNKVKVIRKKKKDMLCSISWKCRVD